LGKALDELKCPKCGATFQTKEELEEHMKGHMKEPDVGTSGEGKVRSYIKIEGPENTDAIKALENLAIDMPEICIMNTRILDSIPELTRTSHTLQTYFSGLPTAITTERCNTIISSSGEMLGEHDFFFEWVQDPSEKQINELKEKIDETLATVGVKYTITTK
jgi:hypothetical protein